MKERCRVLGQDIWKDVTLSEYASWEAFLAQRRPARDQLYFFEENGKTSFYVPNYPNDAYLIFGRESIGLPQGILDEMEDRIFHIPMRNSAVKSLNLSNAATAAIYQALRAQFHS